VEEDDVGGRQDGVAARGALIAPDPAKKTRGSLPL